MESMNNMFNLNFDSDNSKEFTHSLKDNISNMIDTFPSDFDDRLITTGAILDPTDFSPKIFFKKFNNNVNLY